MVQEYLWFLPFLSFLTGYCLVSFFYHSKKLETPLLIGKSLQDSIVLASEKNLNIRLVEERQDSDLPEKTVIVQKPQPGSPVKANQTIFCVTSKRPVITIPHLILKQKDVVLTELRNLGLQHKFYFFESNYPHNVCFGQNPSSQSLLKRVDVTLYIAKESKKKVIFPDLRGKSVSEVIDFLRPYGINPSIQQTRSSVCSLDDSCTTVINQRPLPGSIVQLDVDKPIYVQLQTG